MSHLKERTISSEMIYRGKIINLRVDTVALPQEGQTGTREVIEHAGAVAVVPVTGQEEVLLVRQYRHAAGKPYWKYRQAELNRRGLGRKRQA